MSNFKKIVVLASGGGTNLQALIDAQKRGELGAAQLCCLEFVKHAISTVYLLNNRYEPFYKWAFRGLEPLARLSEVKGALLALLQGDVSDGEKLSLIEAVCSSLTNELRMQELSKATCENLDTHAFSVLDSIKNSYLRNMHIMEGV